MKTRIKLLVFGLIALSITVNSCSKDGETGAIGPQGETGLTGSQGPEGTNGSDGADGSDGQDGNANVIASDWFGPNDQTFITNGYTRYAEFDLDITDVDSNLLDSGTLLVYGKFNNFVEEVYPPGHVSSLPLTINGGTTDHIFIYYFSLNNLKIRYRQDGPSATWAFSPSNQFRYVMVPSNLSSKSNKNFSKMTYEEVIEYFNLDY